VAGSRLEDHDIVGTRLREKLVSVLTTREVGIHLNDLELLRTRLELILGQLPEVGGLANFSLHRIHRRRLLRENPTLRSNRQHCHRDLAGLPIRIGDDSLEDAQFRFDHSRLAIPRSKFSL